MSSWAPVTARPYVVSYPKNSESWVLSLSFVEIVLRRQSVTRAICKREQWLKLTFKSPYTNIIHTLPDSNPAHITWIVGKNFLVKFDIKSLIVLGINLWRMSPLQSIKPINMTVLWFHHSYFLFSCEFIPISCHSFINEILVIFCRSHKMAFRSDVRTRGVKSVHKNFHFYKSS